MTVRSFVSVGCVAVAVLAAGACRDRSTDRERTERERPAQPTEGRPGTAAEPYGQTTVTGANVVGNQSAIDKIVGARCEREATCRNVGADKRFATPDACMQKLKADMHDDLSTKECPHGIDQKELTECIDAIKKEDCNNPIDTIGRLTACRTGDLCLKTAMPNR